MTIQGQNLDEFIATATAGKGHKYKAFSLGNNVVSGKWDYTAHPTPESARNAILNGRSGWIAHELRRHVGKWEVEWSKVVPKQRQAKQQTGGGE